MKSDAFRMDVIRPALQLTGLWSIEAEDLILGTALAESQLDYLKQVSGPALGFYQIEPSTYVDCLRYLNRADNKKLRDSILSACYTELFPKHDALIWNLRLATLMARIKYWMIPEPIPKTLQGQALYWVRHYNSGGKGTEEHYISSWRNKR